MQEDFFCFKVTLVLCNFSPLLFQILPWLWELILLEDTQTVSMHMSPLTFPCVSYMFSKQSHLFLDSTRHYYPCAPSACWRASRGRFGKGVTAQLTASVCPVICLALQVLWGQVQVAQVQKNIDLFLYSFYEVLNHYKALHLQVTRVHKMHSASDSL